MKTPELVVALDFSTAHEADLLRQKLQGLDVIYKVGLELFVAEGPRWVEKLAKDGERVFLDLKLHDIPNTVHSTLRRIESLGVEMTTVHAMGGQAMVDFPTKLRVLGVTILTSHSEQDWAQWTSTWTGADRALSDSFASVVDKIKDWNLGGVVCSPLELVPLKKLWPSAYAVVPGIRSGAKKDDQSRTATPREAAAWGADAMVVGRPITRATQPREAAEAILKEIS